MAHLRNAHTVAVCEIRKPNGYKLEVTGRCAILLRAFLDKRKRTRGELYELLWPDPDLQPLTASACLQVIVARLRRALRGTGWQVAVIWGEGYVLIGPDVA